MGNRYYITGVQIGMLFSNVLNREEANRILQEIEEKQFIGTAEELKELLNLENKRIGGLK